MTPATSTAATGVAVNLVVVHDDDDNEIFIFTEVLVLCFSELQHSSKTIWLNP